jgi:uncharacterized protein (DUF1697 family)
MARAATERSTYVALLRGINVGGNNIVPMKELAATFEQAKLSPAKTYIASGNVLFQAAGSDARALEKKIERLLTKTFRYDAKVVVRSKAEMARVVEGLPRPWKKVDPAVRYYVMFLRHEVDSEDILDDLAPKPELEQVWYGPGVLYWSARFEDLTRTAMTKVASSPIYKHMTIRNLNTTKKLHELLKAFP